jgi:hypothetical protein
MQAAVNEQHRRRFTSALRAWWDREAIQKEVTEISADVSLALELFKVSDALPVLVNGVRFVCHLLNPTVEKWLD